MLMRKITVITGASSGMGAEFARQLFTQYESNSSSQDLQECEIWLIARSTQNLEQVSSSLKGRTQIKNYSMDLSGAAGARKFSDLLEREAAASPFLIECLINNAGFGTYGPFEKTDSQREMLMIDLNCTALTGICGYSLKYMGAGSRIINVSSLAAFMPLGNFAVYAATKSFVLSFSVALAAELKDRKIKVCALCPGSVSTNFANVASNGKRREVLHGRSPQKVVRDCLKKSKKGKKIILTFPKWKITAFLSRFVGRYIVARFTYKYAERPY